MWAPKAGRGWVQRSDGSPIWALLLEPDNEAGPCLFVTVHPGDFFEIGRSHASFEYEVPGPADIKRIELDFGVDAWSVTGGGVKNNGPRIAIVLRAVRL